jgi:formylglycine-generating enzyme required for sulfatase activity
MDWDIANRHANLWGPGKVSVGEYSSGWLERNVSLFAPYPANAMGFYDMTGNVCMGMDANC